MPYRDRHFNVRILRNCLYLAICMISHHWFQKKKYFHILPNFGGFGAKMSFFRYINKPNTENVYKTLPPSLCSKTPHMSEMCTYITNKLCKLGLGTRGNDGLQTKNGGGPAYSTWKTVIANGKLPPLLNFFYKKTWSFVLC